MEFRIADTFTDSLARLSGDEQKAVKTAAFDLQLNPAHPALQFHKIEKAKDPHFWSVRVSLDIRMIVHRTESSLLLCYVNHHDNALSLGGTAQAGNSSENRSGATGGDSGDRQGNRHSQIRGSGTGAPRAAFVRGHPRRATTE